MPRCKGYSNNHSNLGVLHFPAQKPREANGNTCPRTLQMLQHLETVLCLPAVLDFSVSGHRPPPSQPRHPPSPQLRGMGAAVPASAEAQPLALLTLQQHLAGRCAGGTYTREQIEKGFGKPPAQMQKQKGRLHHAQPLPAFQGEKQGV